MKITWYGTASLIIETENSSLLIDPYLKFLPKGYEKEELLENRLKAFQGQKNVLITHGHLDHLSSIIPIYGKGKKDEKSGNRSVNATIYLTKTPYKTLKRRGFPTQSMVEIAAGDRLSFGDITVEVKRGKHVEFVKDDVQNRIIRRNILKCPYRVIKIGLDYFRYPEKDEILFFEIHAENKTVQVMGSAGLREGVDYAKNADILILPHQGRPDIDEFNEYVVNVLQPKRVLIDHYDDAFPPYSKTVPLDGFCRKMSKTIPTEGLVEGRAVEL